MLKHEWLSILKDKKYLAAIIVMFIIPLLYCGMLLWAFWDPYGQLKDLPVALVNNDKGAEFEGEPLHLGDDLVENLKQNATFAFQEVSAEEADQLLKNHEIYMLIQIPEDFSANVTTFLEEEPQRLELEYIVDEAANFITAKIGESSMHQIRAEVNEQIAKTYAETLFTIISRLSDGYGEASDGATKLKDGTAKLQDGAKLVQTYLSELAKGTETLSNRTEELTKGAKAAQSGASELTNGSATLAQGSSALHDGANTLKQGIETLTNGVQEYTAGVSKITSAQQSLHAGQQTLQANMKLFVSGTSEMVTGTEQLAANTAQLAEGISALSTNLAPLLGQLPINEQQKLATALAQLEASSRQIAEGANFLATNTKTLQENAQTLKAGQQSIVENSAQLTAGLEELEAKSAALLSGTTQVTNGATQLAEKSGALQTGTETVFAGVSSLENGLSILADGSDQLANGTKTLSEKSHDLAAGAEEFVTGTEQLIAGSQQLATKLNEAKEAATFTVSDANYEMAASPVEVNKEVKNSVGNYGSGLAPYFISLGLFVGALILTNVYPFVQPAVRPTGVMPWFISKISVPLIVWIAQTLILAIVLLYGFKLEVTSIPLFLSVMFVTSFAFIAIVHLLTVALGDVGRFLALVFLILQLAASAGTFPVQLIPKTLQAFHPYMPMSYAVEAFRHVIATTDAHIVYQNVALLGSIGGVCVAFSYFIFAILYKHRYAKPTED